MYPQEPGGFWDVDSERELPDHQFLERTFIMGHL